MSRLGRRVVRLERLFPSAPAISRCRDCGLEHARKVTLEEIRSIIGPISHPVPADWPRLKVGPFCLCACCWEYRGLAELTHR